MPLRKTNIMFRGALAQETQAFPTFGATIEHKFTLEDVIRPDFWHPQARVLEPGARLRCEWEDGSRTALLRVMGKDAGAREVLVVVEAAQEFPAPALPPGFSLEFVNKSIGWRILEEGRRTPRRTGFATAVAAAHWLRGDRGPKDEPADEPADEAPPVESTASGRRPKPKPAADAAPPAPPAPG